MLKASTKGYDKVERLVMLKMLNNIIASQLSMKLGIKGYHNVLSSLTAGNSAIGEGFHTI